MRSLNKIKASLTPNRPPATRKNVFRRRSLSNIFPAYRPSSRRLSGESETQFVLSEKFPSEPERIQLDGVAHSHWLRIAPFQKRHLGRSQHPTAPCGLACAGMRIPFDEVCTSCSTGAPRVMRTRNNTDKRYRHPQYTTKANPSRRERPNTTGPGFSSHELEE